MSTRVLHDQLKIPLAAYPTTQDEPSSTYPANATPVVVLRHDECVASALLTRPDTAVARARGTLLGLEVEHEVDLGALALIHPQLIEVSRLCVLEAWRGTRATIKLYEAIIVSAWRMGGRYLLGGVDCRTGRADEASWMLAVQQRCQLIDSQYWVPAVEHEAAERASCGPYFYTEDERARAERGELSGLKVAPAVQEFAENLGGRVIARPVPHPLFPRYVTPMLASLEDVPARTLKLLDPKLVAETLGATRPAHEALQQARSIAS